MDYSHAAASPPVLSDQRDSRFATVSRTTCRIARRIWGAALPQPCDLAQMIERHWDGTAVYCKPESKISLGLVEDLSNTKAMSSALCLRHALWEVPVLDGAYLRAAADLLKKRSILAHNHPYFN